MLSLIPLYSAIQLCVDNLAMKPMNTTELLIDLPGVIDSRGELCFLQYPDQLPFQVNRVYYLYNVGTGMQRGAHAHRELQQVMIALNGAFDVLLDDGTSRNTIHLDSCYTGLLINKMVWREMANFTPGAICLVLASMRYDESDYIRNYNDFLAAARDAQQ